MKKRLLALMLVVAMVMGMSMTTFAEGESAKPSTTDATTVNLVKVYSTKGENVVSPAETFNYKIEYVKCTDSGYAEGATIPVPYFDGVVGDDEGTISYIEGEADADGTAKYTALTLPEYEYVGIYTYKITETPGAMAGVTYDENAMYLKVTVIEENGVKRVVALHYETEDGVKNEAFKNEYSADSLSVSKIVTGNLGDQKKEFTVKVTFNAPNGKTVGAPITYVDGSETKTISIDAMSDGAETVEITLKHNETIKFENIPYGVSYTVVENDYTGEGYDAASYVYRADFDGSDNINGTVYTETTLDSSEQVMGVHAKIKETEFNVYHPTLAHYVEITNNKEQAVDTGIFTTNMPYILALVAIAAVAVVMFRRKREF